MIRPSNGASSVYLYQQPVDMRKQMDGLASIVEHEMEQSIFGKSLFVFVNKRRDKLKILCWEKNGFVVWYKRLEKQRFAWTKDGTKKQLTVRNRSF